eukprot:1472263-Pleurochrysis_carterae.AAC.1
MSELVGKQPRSPVGGVDLLSRCRGCQPPLPACGRGLQAARWSYHNQGCGKGHDGQKHYLWPPAHTRCPYTLHGCIRDRVGRADESCCMRQPSFQRKCSASVYLLAIPKRTCSTMSEGQRPSMQSERACCSKAHWTASQNFAIESGLGYSVPSGSR